MININIPTKQRYERKASDLDFYLLGWFLLDKRYVSGTANGGLHREWLVEGLMIEFLIVDRPVLSTSHILVTRYSEPKMRNRKANV